MATTEQADPRTEPHKGEERERDVKSDNGNAEQSEKNAEPEKPKTPFMREHPLLTVIGAIVLALLLVGAFFWWRYLQTYESTDDAFVDGHINIVSSRVPGTVAGVYAVENQNVVPGQTLVDLDPRDLKVSLAQAKAALYQAQAAVNEENPNVPITATTAETGISSAEADVATANAGVAGAERDRESAIAQLRTAEANNAKAQADLARYATLVKKDEVSREEYDQRVAAAQSAQAAVDGQRSAVRAVENVIEQRKAQASAAQSKLNQSRRNAPQQVAAQRAAVQGKVAAAESARAGADQASLNLEYSKILSPVAGIVGRRSVEVGQRIQPGQELLSVVQLDDLWITANFKETQLRNVRPGQSVTVHADAFDRDYDGYVESMPAASGAKFSMLPAENATGNFVKVVQRLPLRIRLKPDQDRDHRLRPGMSVVPKIWVK